MTHPRIRRPAAITGAAVVGLGALGLLAGCGDDTSVDDARTVTVVGTGKVTGAPDVLAADVGIEAQAADVSTALDEASAKVKSVTDAVLAGGVEDRSDVQTQQVSISPQYSNPAPGTSSTISGYQATNTIRITIRDVSKASAVLSTAADAGGNNTRISNIAFSIDDDSELLKKARTAAFDDARSRAQQYAELADDDLGKVLTIDEASSSQTQPATGRVQSDAVAAVPIEPGEQTLSFTVTVKYALT